MTAPVLRVYDRLVMLAMVGGLCAVVFASSAIATMTPFAAATYGYDRAASNAQSARATITRLPGRMAAPTTTGAARWSPNAGLADFVAAESGPRLLSRAWTALMDERGSIGYGDLPSRARTFSNFDEAAAHLERFHGVDPVDASARLHAIKEAFGFGGGDNVLIDRTGNVFNPYTREWLGSLTRGGG